MRKARYIILAIMAMGLMSCASSMKEKGFIVDGVGGDLLIRDIASDAQMPSEIDVSASANIPIDGTQSPLDLAIANRGLFSVDTVTIRNVTGNVVIERALTGTQNVSIPESLEKLFTPGDPFGDWELSTEMTTEETAETPE
ncbi:MAG: hypothetical protein AB1656_05190 [Candidatus Omnitrophota bacterium]